MGHSRFDQHVCGAQVLASIPNLTSGHQIMHQLLTTDLTEDTVVPVAGVVTIPDSPGLGFSLSADAVDECARRFELDGPYAPSG
jgi:L-alanine-DL-glutamate epimerase-like enolase superfamily enzyme